MREMLQYQYEFVNSKYNILPIDLDIQCMYEFFYKPIWIYFKERFLLQLWSSLKEKI